MDRVGRAQRRGTAWTAGGVVVSARGFNPVVERFGAGSVYVDISSWPFQIPLGALIPIRIENLLPAAKNISVTHITNGCYRLHPVEWNIGEAAGALAAYCVDRRVTPRQIRNTPTLLRAFQETISAGLGIVLTWPNPRATVR